MGTGVTILSLFIVIVLYILYVCKYKCYCCAIRIYYTAHVACMQFAVNRVKEEMHVV